MKPDCVCVPACVCLLFTSHGSSCPQPSSAFKFCFDVFLISFSFIIFNATVLSVCFQVHGYMLPTLLSLSAIPCFKSRYPMNCIDCSSFFFLTCTLPLPICLLPSQKRPGSRSVTTLIIYPTKSTLSTHIIFLQRRPPHCFIHTLSPCNRRSNLAQLLTLLHTLIFIRYYILLY